ncbi:hypothetical protein [Natronobeatus ordinarius]|uniref:hypothetical protein n=1 Tax=Natronobeatus ordinarius TaxID=2963433 RepID=UPI0020CDB58E|nr:hypothetical protein [Natronobeatus ordinarius]
MVDVGDASFEVTAVPDDADRVSVCVRAAALSPAAERNRFSVAVETSEFHGEHHHAYGRWNDRTVVLRLEGPRRRCRRGVRAGGRTRSPVAVMT